MPDEKLDILAAHALSDRDRNIQNANSTENALCGQLMLVCTVFLTVSVVVLGDHESLMAVSAAGKVLLIVGLLLIMSSIASGITYYFNNISFYENWSTAHDKDFALLRNREFKSWKAALKELNSHQDGLDTSSSRKWLKVQISFMAAGAVVYVLVVTSILFDFGMK